MQTLTVSYFSPIGPRKFGRQQILKHLPFDSCQGLPLLCILAITVKSKTSLL